VRDTISDDDGSLHDDDLSSFKDEDEKPEKGPSGFRVRLDS
jgi:hypothetical protein